MPITAGRRVHISSGETTWGATGATVVKKLMGVEQGEFKLDDKSEVVQALGWLGPSPIAAEVYQTGTVKLDLVATYEDLPTWLNGVFTAIGQSTTSSGVGGISNGWTYPYAAPLQSTQAINTYRLEYGTTDASYHSLGSVVKDVIFKGEAGSYQKLTIDLLCKQIVPTTSGLSTGTGITDRAVNPVRMADTKLWIDAFSSGTIGTSTQDATLISYEFALKTGRHVKPFAGSLTPGSWGDARMAGTLKFTAEFNANAKSLVDALLNTTGAMVQRQIRIGATQGSSATTKTFNLDFAGTKVAGEKLFDDREGNMTVAFSFDGTISTGLGNWLQMSVINGSSSTT